jgi:hypothetical protein
METPYIYIEKTRSNTTSLYIHKDLHKSYEQSKQFAFIAMDRICLWHTSIGDTYIGFEFDKEFTPEIV